MSFNTYCSSFLIQLDTITTQPSDVTVSTGGVVVFICVVDSNGTNITSDDVRWKQIRLGTGTSTLPTSNRGIPFNITANISGDILTSTLIITGATDSNTWSWFILFCSKWYDD